MKKLLSFIIICVSTFSWSNNQLSDTSSYWEKKQSGNYYPYYKIHDTVLSYFPVKGKVDIRILDLQNISLGENSFYVKMENFLYPTAPLPLVIIDNGEGYENQFYDYTFFNQLIYQGRDDVRVINNEYIIDKTNPSYNKEFYNQWYSYFEGTLPFRWDLRDYPFDVQTLKIEMNTREDTSWVQLLNEGSLDIKTENFKYLMDGFKVTGDMEIVKNVKLDDELHFFADGKRERVTQKIMVTLNLSREGAFLYFKLFFGAILSFLISVLAFFIDTKEFESRITLCVASVFGAIGNKYFVESSMPEIQILTKADMINNLMIFLVIVNICLIIAQQSSKLKLGFLEKNVNATIFSIILFIITNLIIVYV